MAHRSHKTRVTLPYLHEWREKRLLTQAELSQRSGVAKSTIVRLERGDQTAILSTVSRLADALGISREQLVRTRPTIGAGEREGEEPEDDASQLPHVATGATVQG